MIHIRASVLSIDQALYRVRPYVQHGMNIDRADIFLTGDKSQIKLVYADGSDSLEKVSNYEKTFWIWSAMPTENKMRRVLNAK